MIPALIVLLFIFFIGLIFVFRYLLTQNISSATAHLDNLTKDYAKKQEKVKQELKEAEETRRKTIHSARQEAEEIKRNILNDARQEKEKIMAQAVGESKEIINRAERTRKQLIEEEQEKIAAAASGKAVELFRNILPSEIRKNLHNYWVQELVKKGLKKLENLNIPEEEKKVEVVSAFPLEASQKKEITATFEDKLGKKIQLVEKIDSAIIAGVVISVGSLVFDGSLKDKVDENR